MLSRKGACWGRRIVIGIAGLQLLLAAACSPTFDGGPARLANDPRDSFLMAGFSARRLAEYRDHPGADRLQLRNSIVLSAMGAMDVSYNRFEMELTRERQAVPFAATVTSIALSGAGSLVTDSATKTALAVVDTALKGTKEAYDKEILVRQTIGFLQTQMRANRNEVRIRIINQLALPVEAYPLELALIDLEDYYAAGTITAGLIQIGSETTRRLAISEEMKILSTATFGADENTKLIRAHLERGGEAASRELAEWLAGIPAFQFMTGAQYAALRAKYVARITRE